VDTAFNQPGNETAQFRLIDLAPLIEGHQQWSENAVEPRQATRIHGSAPLRMINRRRVARKVAGVSLSGMAVFQLTTNHALR
jgi:hypothetical protein